MPERWEREIEKLGTLTAPRSTSARVAEGPQGHGMPPPPGRGQRLAAVVVAFAVFGAAAAFAAGAFRRETPSTQAAAPDPATTVVVRLSSDGGPSATLEFDGHQADPQVGSYCWNGNGSGRCVDTALTGFAKDAFVQVPSGTPIALVGDDGLTGASATLDRTGDPNDVIQRQGPVTPVDTIGDGSDRYEGGYVLTVDAEWPQGSVQFFFPIEISATTSHAPSPDGSVLRAVLEAPADGSMPELVLSYAGHTQRFVAQDGRWPGVDGFTMPLQMFDVPIDRGTTISLESDADEVGGTLFISDRDQHETGTSFPLDLGSGSATLPSDGYYRLVLKGTWPPGEAGFNVGITIGTPPSDWPPAALTAVVPDVVGFTQPQAVKVLTAAGFVSISVATPAGQSGGLVSEQDPAAGTETATTTTIKLSVSPSS
jgi:hypothetical protein